MGRGGERPPGRSPLPPEERDRGRANRSGLMAVRGTGGRHATPRDLTRETQPVEPQRIILLEPGGQHVRFPRPGGDCAPVREVEHRGRPLRPLGPRPVGHPLPAEQEAKKVRRRDRLDLPAQPVERVTVDAREQSAFAPLELRHARREATAQHEPFPLERREPEVYVAHLQAERRGECRGGGTTPGLEPPPHQLAGPVLPRPRLRPSALGTWSPRRVMTAWVRRSSSGASSRKAYGLALSTSCARGDGSGVSRATSVKRPASISSSTRLRPGKSIASSRQSAIVWLTSG